MIKARVFGITKNLETNKISIGTHKIETMKNPIAPHLLLYNKAIMKKISAKDNTIKADAKMHVRLVEACIM